MPRIPKHPLLETEIDKMSATRRTIAKLEAENAELSLKIRRRVIGASNHYIIRAFNEVERERDEAKARIAELEAENKRLKADVKRWQSEAASYTSECCGFGDRVAELEAENKRLQHEHDSTRGLWCVDRNPSTVDLQWIRVNCFQLESLKGGE